jgi:hypothetical protein
LITWTGILDINNINTCDGFGWAWKYLTTSTQIHYSIPKLTLHSIAW